MGPELSVKTILEGVVYVANRFRNRGKNLLHPWYDADTIEKSRKYYIPTKCQARPPHLEDEPSKSPGQTPQEDFFDFLRKSIKEDVATFYFILAGAGMGKTTAFINFFYHYKKQFGPLYNIQLLPLGDPSINEELERLTEDPEKCRETLLFLDAFDEDPMAQGEYQTRLDEIVSTTRNFRKVYISCRTQFLPNELDEEYEILVERQGTGGFQNFVKTYISPLSTDEVNSYLKKKFKNSRDIKKAKAIAEKSSDLMARPLLLSWIDELLELKSTLLSPFEIYDSLIRKWIERESLKQIGQTKSSGFMLEEFQNKLTQLAEKFASMQYDFEFNRHSLVHPLTIAVAQEEGKKLGLDIDKIDVKSRSLLNRTPGRKAHYKFAHRSIYDFLIAKREIYIENVKEARELQNALQISFFHSRIQRQIDLLKRYNIINFDGKSLIIDCKEANVTDSVITQDIIHLRYFPNIDIRRLSFTTVFSTPEILELIFWRRKKVKFSFLAMNTKIAFSRENEPRSELGRRFWKAMKEYDFKLAEEYITEVKDKPDNWDI